MSKKFFMVGVILALALALVFNLALASGTKTHATAKHAPAANIFAVCGCGKVFTPTSATEYVTVNGKTYACCSHTCHEQAIAMAQKDPAGTAKMMEDKIAQAKEKLSPTTAATQTAPK